MFRGMKLGRIEAPVPTHAPSLRAHAIAGLTAPPRLLRDHVGYQPAMDGNDDCGDCTCVALANAIRAQAALQGYQVDVQTSEVLGLYSAVSGYNPNDPATDQGAVVTDVLSYQAQHGFMARPGDSQSEYVGLWANIDVGDLNLLRLATARFGVGYLGLSLAEADQEGGRWDVGTPASYGDDTPGSWGGHAALLWAWSGLDDDDTVLIASWGRLVPATWPWVRSRLTEAHAVLHPQMAGPRMHFSGVDLDTLRADVAAFT